MSQLWVPIRPSTKQLYLCPDIPLTRDGLAAGQYVTQWNGLICSPLTIGAETMPVDIANDAEVGLCTKRISNPQVPAADLAKYADALVKTVAAGRMTQAEAEALATALGLQLD